MTDRELIAQAEALLDYDKNSGELRWKQNELVRKDLRGQIAGWLSQDGYRYLKIDNKRLCAHRVVWMLYHKEIPDQIDHINMDRADNRIANLRNACIAENNRNRTKQSNNTSGFKGVTFHKSTKKYHAKIMVNKVRHSLGYFENAETASVAYQNASRELHGNFSRY